MILLLVVVFKVPPIKIIEEFLVEIGWIGIKFLAFLITDDFLRL
jgi:hypothetical protein